MPNKRSRSQEREKKQRQRERKKLKIKDHASNEGENAKPKYDEKKANRERMRKIRAKQSNDEKKLERNKLKERMRKLRANESDDEKELQREEAKERMANLRANKLEDKKDYENLLKRQNQRKLRALYSGKQHLKANLAAKKGMRLFAEEGRLKKFSIRESVGKNIDKEDGLREWKKYMEKSDKHRDTLNEKEPDIVQKINEHLRKKKEKQREEMEKKREEDIEMYWEDDCVSENEEPQDDVGYIIISKEQSDCFEEDEREAMIKYRKKKEKEKRQLSRENMKEALAKPLKPLPKKELCQYERIRAQIIAEREEYMRKCNFYNDLEKAKKDIG